MGKLNKSTPLCFEDIVFEKSANAARQRRFALADLHWIRYLTASG
jgi:hypothetical protein